MGKRRAALVIVLLVLFCVIAASPNMWTIRASGIIYIKADGTVEGTYNIQRDRNTYTFTDDINGAIVVEKDDIVVEGAGYTLNGGEILILGFAIYNRSNVIVRNVKVVGFTHGINLCGSTYCTITENTVTESSVAGIQVAEFSKYNNGVRNIVTENSFNGLSIIYGSSENLFRGNIMQDNKYNMNVKGAHLFSSDVQFYVNDVDTSNLVD